MATRKVVFSPRAASELRALRRYIAREASSLTARRFTDSIVDFCDGLATFPDRGVPRNDLRPGLRTLSFRGRVIVAYSVGEERVTILALFYAGQDFENALSDD